MRGPGRLRAALGETLQEAQPSGATCTQMTLGLEPRSEEARVLKAQVVRGTRGAGVWALQRARPPSCRT